MIYLEDALVTNLSAHRVGNQTEGEVLMLSEESIPVKDEHLQSLIKRYLISPFNNPEYFVFREPVTNPIAKAVSTIFKNPAKLHEMSCDIAKHHYEKAVHVSIPAGDLVVAHLRDVRLDGEATDLVAIFKVEHNEDFLQLTEDGDNYHLGFAAGINLQKPEKVCLIFNMKGEEGFRVCQLDKTSRLSGGVYWKDDFLNLVPAVDNYHDTANFMNLTKAFVSDKLTEEFEVDRADQATFLNRSISYLKENDQLDGETFGATVFGDPSVMESFKNFKDFYEQENALQIPEGFAISPQAVKKQARIFKSVLKLDKNFHIYIHGNRNMIERGTDDGGRKFYKIYYNQET
ncbi:MAG: nucleoid-associated protein [Flavobacteriales bacterium]|nr:nucleoid-associated protein [Flavobacteriales bacterium]MCB9447485.1 nucleoid-associated protein [Flavobacteriales bacterium]